ncbi:MAG TPA: sn-glycerol-3-phosphate ABC transporter ATP-binding protein UgpC [Emcibacteraceae bacterium]|nr:sn-glycerol-3-phosphate ABC transporter ATP-binding protein UgpC [Emcibacteraceae bacterium]
MASVTLSDISKNYGKVSVIEHLDLEIMDKEFIVLVGPSGCGKSTLLRMIAGLEDITGGKISIADRVVNNLEPRDRDIAMVFQNYALYPHMNVYKNISFGLRARKTPKSDIEKQVAKVAEILGIRELLNRKPSELSGGQRQRVAMGRAMVRNPAVFLFDEPLSNLDAKLRATMRAEIKKLHRTVETTMIYVTHDQVEAMTLADRIVIMDQGKIQQIGTPMEVYNTPANKFVAGFIGSPEMNFIKSKDGITLGIRPEDIYLSGSADIEKGKNIKAVVEVVEPLGAETLLIALYDGTRITAKLNGLITLEAGAEVKLTLDMSHAHLFDKDGQRV